MLDLFKDEIPELDKLVTLIRQMLVNPRYSLEDIKEEIIKHISEQKGIHPDDDDKLGEACSVACNAVDDRIDELDETEINCNRIREYIKSFQSYNGYNRLITDFQGHITDHERQILISDGKRLFVSEITEHWT